MKCGDVRWQLTEFLGAVTSPAQDDLIRDHLDQCPDCAVRLVSSGRVDAVELSLAPRLSADITGKILAYYPESPTGMVMVRHLSWVFLVSASFAVGVFSFVRRMLASPTPSAFNPVSQIGDSNLEGVATQLFTSPLASYITLALLATALCIMLIYLVDRPMSESKSISQSPR